MYGPSNLSFKKNGDGVVLEADRSRFYQTLQKEILDERVKGRPVIVYFETVEKLKEFSRSEYGQRLKDVITVTEKTENIPFFVNKATVAGTITFFPRVFGRGLDFISRDPAVDAAGGVHVIQTFFSPYISEEIQIKGRTARQAKRGSFKMILLLEELLPFGLTAEELTQSYEGNTFYESINAKRMDAINFHVTELVDKATNASSLHKKSMEFLEKLRSQSNKKSIVDLMISFESSGGGGPVDVIFCLDDSGSMASDWSALLQAVDGFLTIREEKGGQGDRISVIQFNSQACQPVDSVSLAEARRICSQLTCRGGGTSFSPALTLANQLLSRKQGVDAVLVFMTDGDCSDRAQSVALAQTLCTQYQGSIQFFGLAFRTSGGTLLEMTKAAGGTCVSAGNVAELKVQFQDIARTVSANQGKRA
jgi:Mg-chelatase subunit ChlD